MSKEIPAMVMLTGDQRKEYDKVIDRCIGLWAEFLNPEQKQMLHQLVIIHGMAGSLRFLSEGGPPEMQHVMGAVVHHLYEGVNRWAKKGRTMSNNEFEQVYGLLERVATEVREHYENRINGEG